VEARRKGNYILEVMDSHSRAHNYYPFSTELGYRLPKRIVHIWVLFAKQRNLHEWNLKWVLFGIKHYLLMSTPRCMNKEGYINILQVKGAKTP
jgi:hypothetical protein